ncbi:MAG: ethanolamine ammonia-lyase subunit EutC [Bacteroidota bacterium]
MNKGWDRLKSFTAARVALGRVGGSLTTRQLLQFRKDHALARDAVWADLNVEKMSDALKTLAVNVISVSSQATDRQTYIKRPDLGRKLGHSSAQELNSIQGDFELSISIADGLSALAVERHSVPFLASFLPLITSFKLSPITLIRQGRVAISDQIGERFGSILSIILIGERPGLSSPDSMGVYMTYGPSTGNTDEKRNCISNIRKEGLSYEFAAQKLAFLISESLRRKLSGVDLKDTFDLNSKLSSKS